VVGARSVVIEDVPPFSVAVGNPARIIRKLDADAPHLHVVSAQTFNPPPN
jgi:maltose O-acetyltransferase